MQISSTGSYYESSQPYVDPIKFNDAKKPEQQTRAGPIPELEVKPFVWAEVWAALSQHKTIQPVTQPTVLDFKAMHAELIHQCQVLRDIVQGMIVGDRNTLALEQQHNFNQEIDAIFKDLTDIEMSQQFIGLVNPRKQRIDFKTLQDQLHQKQQSQQDQEPYTAITVVGDTGSDEFARLEKRLAVLEKYIGIGALTQVGKGKDFALSHKGCPIISTSNVLETKPLTFKSQDQLVATQYSQQIPQPEPMPILQHLKVLKTAIEIIQGARIPELEETPEPAANISEALDFGKKHENQLIVADEIPWIIERLQSLRSVHDESIKFPTEISTTQSDLLFMVSQLQETSELLDLLDHEISENSATLNENIQLLKN